MSRALINVVNTTSGTTINAGSTYPLTQVVRKFGCDIYPNGTGVTCKNSGYYKVAGTISAEASGAGTATVSVYVNGNPYTGASSSTTVASGDTFTLPVNTVVRVNCCANPADITLVLSGVSATTVNGELTVSKE